MGVLAEAASADASLGWSDFLAQSFYHAMILPLLGLTLTLAWLARPSTTEPIPPGFRSFQLRYFGGWCLCVAADWLQGPYVYALYSAYGFERREIAQLFVAGFASSLVVSCFVGSLIDRFGRKRSVLAYCLLYTLACLSKHCNDYWVLLCGRIASGFSSSLLFSSFECWMVSEHLSRQRFPSSLLADMFGLMYSLMYTTAIISGVVAQAVADSSKLRPISDGSAIYIGGPIAPCDVAVCCLCLGSLLVALCWHENYGTRMGSPDQEGSLQTLTTALAVMCRNRRIWLLGVVVASFEGAMWAFVFNWTPALESDVVPPPFGLIFALFMMACMCGASLGTMASRLVRPVLRLGLVCITAMAAFFIMLFTVGENLRLCFFAFLLFECLVGVYFPTVGVLKSQVVPESMRGTIYNIYRVPLNVVVVCLLLTDLSLLRCFGFCASMLLFASIAAGFIGRSADQDPVLPSVGKL